MKWSLVATQWLQESYRASILSCVGSTKPDVLNIIQERVEFPGSLFGADSITLQSCNALDVLPVQIVLN